MSNETLWVNIQQRASAQAQRRAKMQVRLARELTMAAQDGLDLDGNSRLRLAVDKALGHDMPEIEIERAIARSANADYEEVRYEGIGPGDVAVMVDCMTDNRNRTVAEVRMAFSQNGGRLSDAGSVSALFKQVGVLKFAAGSDIDAVQEEALLAGAEEVLVFDNGVIEVLTPAEDYSAVLSQIVASGLHPDDADVELRAERSVPLDEATATQVASLMDALDDIDDTQEVCSNGCFSEGSFDV